jgi:LuxR family transcriptional regulator, maltose regulon positive regulatory protein
MQTTAAGAIESGRAALVRGAWAEARAHFEQGLAAEQTPDGYEGLGIAARYLWDAEAAVAAHERGYRLARAADDQVRAARLAAQLAIDAYTLGRMAEANGWIERALMLTEGAAPCEGRALALALRAHAALLVRDDPPAAAAFAAEALDVARAAGSTDIELVALAVEGLALVCGGAVEAGMRRLDAATAAAVAGELDDVDLAETVCCYLIDACKRVRDLTRAAEWCERVGAIARRFDDRFMFAVCRVHHADVLIWRGAWADADSELATAAELFRGVGSAKELDSVVRVAELRRRQGRLDEAAELLAACQDHRLHALHAGLLALDRSQPRAAFELATRFLRRVGEGDRFARIAGLELLVQAAAQLGDVEAVASAAAEIRATADVVGTGPLVAAALLAEGRAAAARGELATARARMEDAAAGFAEAGAPFECANAWLGLAATLRALGDDVTARAVGERARVALAGLGAWPAADREPHGLLSPRELEVLRLVAQGRSNDEIAASLFLSVRTVERHVANVYAKLSVSGRSARAAATAWAHAHGAT